MDSFKNHSENTMTEAKEILSESAQRNTANHLDNSITCLEKAIKASKRLKDGKRLEKDLKKMIGDLEDELRFVEMGEYN